MTKLEEAAFFYREAKRAALIAAENVEALAQQSAKIYAACESARLEKIRRERALEEAEVALHEAAAEARC